MDDPAVSSMVCRSAHRQVVDRYSFLPKQAGKVKKETDCRKSQVIDTG